MLDQILWLDVVLKLGAGLPLMLLPETSLRLAGLAHAGARLSARLLGAAMTGIALAILVEAALRRPSGLGPGGAFAINLTGTAVLGLVLVAGKTELPFRGRALLWLLLAAMALLAALELPYS